MEVPQVDADRVGATGASREAPDCSCSALDLGPLTPRCSSRIPSSVDYKRVWEMDPGKDAYLELREFFRFSGSHAGLRQCRREVGYIDIQFLTDRIPG